MFLTQVMREKSREMDMEIHFKDAFRAFSKDDEGGFPICSAACQFYTHPPKCKLVSLYSTNTYLVHPKLPYVRTEICILIDKAI